LGEIRQQGFPFRILEVDCAGNIGDFPAQLRMTLAELKMICFDSIRTPTSVA
jgi:formylmethanofuran dehydrogenase subunit B